NVTMHGVFPLILDNEFNQLRPTNPAPGQPGIKMAAWAVYLESTLGGDVVQNKIKGHLSSSYNEQANRLRYGIIVRRSAKYSTRILHNQTENLFAAVQTEFTNPQLMIGCNVFKKSSYALSVNPQT